MGSERSLAPLFRAAALLFRREDDEHELVAAAGALITGALGTRITFAIAHGGSAGELAREIGDGRVVRAVVRDPVADPAALTAYLDLVATDLELRTKLASARQTALTDPLTGCYNYRYFSQRIVEEAVRSRRYGRPLSLALIDTDGLKRINDDLGHAAGNEHIRELAETIRARIRTSDISVRWGGDEFVIIQPESTLAQAMTTAERIRRTVAGMPFIDSAGRVLHRRISAGVASWPESAGEPEMLFDLADRALYAVKRAGGGVRAAEAETRPDIGVPEGATSGAAAS